MYCKICCYLCAVTEKQILLYIISRYMSPGPLDASDIADIDRHRLMGDVLSTLAAVLDVPRDDSATPYIRALLVAIVSDVSTYVCIDSVPT
jgi:hypothetical protein